MGSLFIFELFGLWVEDPQLNPVFPLPASLLLIADFLLFQCGFMHYSGDNGIPTGILLMGMMWWLLGLTFILNYTFKKMS